MLKKTTFILLIKSIILTLAVQSVAVQASLLISPMMVALNDRERSKEVILVNTSAKTLTYRVSWVEQRALPSGGYKALTEQEINDFPIASPMMRFSPKQVRLGPGERQTIKLSVRRPKGLAQGEYRSHLSFAALPSEKKKNTNITEGAGLSLELTLSYSIPVIVRNGKMDYSVTIDDAKVLTSRQKGKTRYDLEVSMSRSGLNSTAGSLRAYWKKDGSDEEIDMGILNSVHFYPEIQKGKYKLYWLGPKADLKSGKLRIIYEGKKDFTGIIFAEKTFTR